MIDLTELITLICGIAILAVEVFERNKFNKMLKYIEDLKIEKSRANISYLEMKKKYIESKSIITEQKKAIEDIIQANCDKEILYIKAISYWFAKFNSKPIILSEHAVKLIDETKFIEECPVCFELIDSKDRVITICGHQFHKTCFKKWSDSTLINTCPICRA